MLICVDTETTGLDHKIDAVVEVAAVPLVFSDDKMGGTGDWFVLFGASSLVAPGRRIPPEARAVHHLSDEELRTAPQLPQALANVLTQVNVKGEPCEALVAHNAPFDRGFIGQYFPSNLPWLDTCRLAMHLYPDAPAYGNMVLFYWLSLRLPPVTDPGISQTIADTVPRGGTHTALYDATVTAYLLAKMLETNTVAELLEMQDKPVLQRTCRFGKHRETAWSDVPRDYLKWVLNQSNPPFEGDVLHTCRFWLGY